MSEDRLPLGLGQPEQAAKFTTSYRSVDDALLAYFNKGEYSFKSGIFSSDKEKMTKYALMKEKNGRFSIRMPFDEELVDSLQSEELLTLLVHTLFTFKTIKRELLKIAALFLAFLSSGYVLDILVPVSFVPEWLIGVFTWVAIIVTVGPLLVGTIMGGIRKTDRKVYTLRPNLPQVLRKVGDSEPSERDDYYKRAAELESS